ncbi:hypothetical protein UB45_05035 [Terrabacter sp. 28]|nr:hypothetical protein UB45_05035 [Terrabacter sp. 28]
MTEEQGRYTRTLTDDLAQEFHSAFIQRRAQIKSMLEQPGGRSLMQSAVLRQIDVVIDDIYDLLFEPPANLVGQLDAAEAQRLLEASEFKPFETPGNAYIRMQSDLASFVNDALEPVVKMFVLKPQTQQSDRERVDRRFVELRQHLRDLGFESSQYRLNEVVTDAEATRDQAKDIAEDIKETAGTAAEGELSKHFDDYAKAQRQQMWTLRRWGLSLIGLGVVLAALVVFKTEKPLSWDNELARLALSLPMFFVAYYLLREAGHHRESSQRAAEHAVRLKSVKSYSDSLPEEDASALRMDFGKRVFTGSETSPAGSLEPIDLKDPTALVNAITALVGSVRK